jgi:hypothetical protein
LGQGGFFAVFIGTGKVELIAGVPASALGEHAVVRGSHPVEFGFIGDRFRYGEKAIEMKGKHLLRRKLHPQSLPDSSALDTQIIGATNPKEAFC